jgi:hypothetical protein
MVEQAELPVQIGQEAKQSPFLSEAALWIPDYIDATSAWTEHIPFGFWLTQAFRPGCFVELGTHSGVSYLAFCQAIETLALPTRAYAVDLWRGDEHSGYYGDHILDQLTKIHDAPYARFSRLMRATFNEAVNQFADQSINLLHIDGLHTYDGVKHDYETWFPKLAQGSVVLFHATNVRERGFGVWKLWNELAESYPHFEFLHGHGLGVLGIGKSFPSSVEALFAATAEPTAERLVRRLFSRLGASVACTLMVDQMANEVRARDARIVEQEAFRRDAEEYRRRLKRTEEELLEIRLQRDALRSAFRRQAARRSNITSLEREALEWRRRYFDQRDRVRAGIARVIPPGFIRRFVRNRLLGLE